MKTPGDVSGTSRARVFGKDAGARWLAKHDVKTARPWRGIISFTHLAREGRMTVTIGRRELLVALGGPAAAWPLAARAQQPERLRRIGVLIGVSGPAGQARAAALVQGLGALNWHEGRNLRIDWRWAGGDTALYERYAAELVVKPQEVIPGHTELADRWLACEANMRPVPVVAMEPSGQRGRFA